MRGFAERDKHCRELRWQRGEESGDTDESNVLLGVSTTTPGSSEAKETDTAEVECQSGTGIRACIRRLPECSKQSIKEYSNRWPTNGHTDIPNELGCVSIRLEDREDLEAVLYHTCICLGGTDGQC